MAKLSKEQIKKLTDRPALYTTIRLVCDGFRISLQDNLVKRKVRTRLYVDGSVKGIWFAHPEDHPEDHPEIKFYRQRFINVMTGARTKKETIEVIRHSDFASVGQALRHLNQVCDSVEVIEESDCE